MPKAIATDLQIDAQALYISGMPVSEIAKQLSIKPGTINCWATRKGWVAKRCKRADVVAETTVHVMRDAAEGLRDRLGNGLLKAVDALGGKRISYRDLANQGQGHAAVLKTLAETHRTLYGGAEMNVLVFGAANMERDLAQSSGPQPVVVDVPTEVNATDNGAQATDGQQSTS